MSARIRLAAPSRRSGPDATSCRIPTASDREAIGTFEGTETMQTLIVGRDITGIAAFA